MCMWVSAYWCVGCVCGVYESSVCVGSQGGGETTESSSMVNGASREADGVVGVGGQNHLSSDFGEKERWRARERERERGGRERDYPLLCIRPMVTAVGTLNPSGSQSAA